MILYSLSFASFTITDLLFFFLASTLFPIGACSQLINVFSHAFLPFSSLTGGKNNVSYRVLGKYFIQYEKDSDLIGSEEIENVEDQLL